ncbi:MAG: hypothetical protein H6737_20045 [Alphaproteobacteria bacterium]|nr:hypothetical protein [Alphaproteobacteria bacterium]
MRLADQLPAEVAEVYFALRWTDESLHALGGDVRSVPVAALEPHLDLAYWASAPPERIFDLRPRDVLADPARFPGHTARIDAAELRWPLRVAEIEGMTLVLDGLHRLAQAVRQRETLVRVVSVDIDLSASTPSHPRFAPSSNVAGYRRSRG